MQTINEQIAALQEQLRGLDQDKAFGELDREAYWAEDARIRKEINRLREQQPSNMYSPEAKPGHFADPAKQARQKALDDYNAKLSNLRNNGIKDSYGHPDKTTEKALQQIYTSACSQLAPANTLEWVNRIIDTTEKKVRDLNQYRNAA